MMEFPVYAKKKKPASRQKGDMMDEYLSVKDQNMKLKRSKAENDQRMKEMGTKLTIMTTKLSKLQSAEGGGGGGDDAVEETIARLQLQNRDLQRKNAELAERKAAGRPKRAGSAAAAARKPAGGGGARGVAPARPRTVSALQAASGNSWAPSSNSSASSDAIESKLRTILQERDMQIRQLEDEKERLRSQMSSEVGSGGGMKELQHKLQSKQSQLDLVESKFEQLDSSFKALRSNHEKALGDFDVLNKELVDERRNSLSVKHDKKVLQVTQDQVKTLEDEVEKLRKQKADAEDQAQELLEKAMNGQATQQYKEQINDAARRIKELTRANGDMEGSVKQHADEVARLKDKVATQEKSHGSYQGEKKKYESNMTELEVTNKQLMEKLSIFTGDTGIDIDDLEKALSIVKKGDVQGLATSGPARGLEQSSETTETLKREQAGLVQEVAKLTQMTKVQDAISEDLKSEIDAQKIKFGQLQREYDYKLQEANRTLAVRAERVRILETRLRNQIYALAHSNQQGSLRDSMTGKSLGGGGPQIDDDTESLMSDGAFDEDVEDGENIFEITIRELLLDESVKTESGIPPATFFAFDFFEFETQTTPVVSGTRQQLNYTSQFVVKVDAFFLNYLATKTMKLDLFQSCGGMEFKELATCQMTFRKLLDTLASSPPISSSTGPPYAEITADMVNISGGGGKNSPLIRTVVGTVTYRLRFRQSASQAIQVVKERLAAHSSQASLGNMVMTGGEDNVGRTETRELCIMVDSAADLKPRLPNTAPKPYVHYKLLDFPDKFSRTMDGAACEFKDLECYRLEVGGDDSPMARWLSTGCIEFTVFDQADDTAEFFFGTAKVRLSNMTSYPGGKVMASPEIVDSAGDSRGSIAVEIFWSHSMKDSDRVAERAAAVAAAAKSKKRPTPPVGRSREGGPAHGLADGPEQVPKEIFDADDGIEELVPVDGGPGSLISGTVNLNLQDVGSKGSDRYAEAEPAPATEAAGGAVSQEAKAAGSAAGQQTPVEPPPIEIKVHQISCPDELLADETFKQLYVAVEWLQDMDGEGGSGQKELETPSVEKKAVIEYTVDNSKSEPFATYGAEIKRKLAEGTAVVEFALVNDPGGENPTCDDVGVAKIDLKTDVLEVAADMAEKVLPILDESGKKVAEITVSITALEALTALA